MNDNAKIAIFIIAFYFVVHVILFFMYPVQYIVAVAIVIGFYINFVTR